MTLLAGAAWSPTDDDGTGNTGTPVNAAWVAAIKASIEANIHSTTNPTIDVNDIIDEVRNARVSGATDYASLDARLDALDAVVAVVPTPGAILAGVGKVNLVTDETFLLWHLGDAVAPSLWTLAGAGGTAARCGTGLADTNRKIGDFCVRIRRVAADTTLVQSIVTGAAFTRASAAFQGKVVGLGAWVRSTSAGGARIFINDGVGITYSTANVAANTWEWLTVTRTFNVAASGVTVGIINDVNGADAYLSGVSAILGDIGSAPSEWMPAPVEYCNYTFTINGAVAVLANKFTVPVHRPGIVKDIQMAAGIVPTGANLIVDVNTWDGAAFTTMTTTKPVITAGNRGSASQPPDGTYARRCLYPNFVSPTTAGAMIGIDVDQVGSGVTGSDLTVTVRVLHPLRYLESILAYSDI